MTEHVYTTKDRTGWAEGPWDSEPDKIVWVDEATNLDCMIRRGPLGSLCGYVGVPPGHPWHGCGYSDCVDVVDHEECAEHEHTPDALIDVHGGLTFAGPCDGDEETGICHIPTTDRADPWWFGFDCGHFRDISPGLDARERQWGWLPPPSGRQYRDVPYVRAEVLRLAAQLQEVM